jgi:N-acetylglucosamine transport system permease protein
MVKKHYLYAGLGYLIVGLWVLFSVALIGWVLFASLATSGEIVSGHILQFRSGLHFENYVRAWTTHKVSVFFMNSLLYTLASCAAIVFIAAPAAYALSRFRFAGSGCIRTMFAAALGLPAAMIVMPLFGMASTLQFANNHWTLMLLYTAMNVPFGVVFLLAFFKNLSFAYEETAAMDGCSPIGTFWRIMFPLAQPGIVTVTMLNFIAIWNECFMALVFANKSSAQPVAVGLYGMIRSVRYTGDWSGMFAGVVIVLLPLLIVYILFSERIIRGVTAGALKG